MKVYEKIKSEIISISDGMEMAGFLDGIQASAIVYCKTNCPEEFCMDGFGKCVVSICGMAEFLNSEV